MRQQIKHYRALNKWFKTPLGHFVAHEFSLELDSIKDYLKGDVLLQLGTCADNVWLNTLNYNKKWIVSPYPLAHKVALEARVDHLPLNRNSIDCVLAPLNLEPFHERSILIDEIDRVLRPMGLVIFLCINPWSHWGAALKTGLFNCYDNRQIKLCTPFSLNRMLTQRGYRQIALTNFCYIPPIQSASWIKKLTFMDEIGKMLWPVPSGLYCYIAQKHQLIEPSIMLQAKAQLIPEFPLQAFNFTELNFCT